jgi:hypothetical protein
MASSSIKSSRCAISASDIAAVGCGIDTKRRAKARFFRTADDTTNPYIGIVSSAEVFLMPNKKKPACSTTFPDSIKPSRARLNAVR